MKGKSTTLLSSVDVVESCFHCLTVILEFREDEGRKKFIYARSVSEDISNWELDCWVAFAHTCMYDPVRQKDLTLIPTEWSVWESIFHLHGGLLKRDMPPRAM